MNTVHTSLRILLVVMILFSILAGEDNSKLKEGDPAPPFILKDINDQYVFLRDFCGEKLRFSARKREKCVVILSFFTTYCPPCQNEIPILQDISEEFSGQNLRIFLVDLKEKKVTLQKYLNTKENLQLPVLLDRYGVTAEKYGVSAVPALFIIDQQGIIRLVNRGFSSEEEFKNRIIPLIKELLNIAEFSGDNSK